MNTPILILGICLAAWVLYHLLKSSAQSDVHRNFRLSPSRFKLIGTDLGGRGGKVRLSYFGVCGDPDAIFEDTEHSSILVGEYKARRFRHGVRPREFYQVMLYIGLAKRRWPGRTVAGVLSYTDRTVYVEYDDVTFQALVAMREEAAQAIHTRRVINHKPLHERIRVRIPS